MPETDTAATAENARERSDPLQRKRSSRQIVRNKLAQASATMMSAPFDAIPLAGEAFTASQELGDVALQGEAALVLADCYSKSHDPSKTQEFVERALSSFERLGRYNRLGKAYALHAWSYIAQSHCSLALAAAAKALAYPDLRQPERTHLLGSVTVALLHVFGLPTANALIEGRLLSEADLSAEPGVIASCYSLAAQCMLGYACWARDIPHFMTIGQVRPAGLLSSANYLETARQYVLVCDRHVLQARLGQRAWVLSTRAAVVSSTEGFTVAQPVFAQALAASEGFARSQADVLNAAGMAARIDQRWDEALAWLIAAQNHPDAQDDGMQREIQYELAHVYRALGRIDDALSSLELFTQLHIKLTRLANTWINDSPNMHRYGKELNLDRLRSSVLEPVEPAALKRASEYVGKNLDQKLTISEIARHAKVSPRALRTLYKKFKGVPASDFIRERRMQRANELLQRGHLSVQRVADAIGYSNAANFSRDFRKRFGLAPSEVRRVLNH